MTRRRKVRTTIPTPSGVSSPDLVRRDWFQDAPDIVWVADFTLRAHSMKRWVAYVSFLQDGFSRRILAFHGQYR